METKRLRYLVIGDEEAAEGAIEGIRARDGSGPIGVAMVSSSAQIARARATGVERLHGLRIASVDLARREAFGLRHERLSFEQLVVEVPAVQRRELPVSQAIVDAWAPERVAWIAKRARRIGVVGGGLQAVAVASELAQQGKAVTLVHGGQAICSGFGARGFGEAIEAELERVGVTIAGATATARIEATRDGVEVVAEDGRRLAFEGVIVADGLAADPLRAALAGAAGDSVVSVDASFRTAKGAAAIGEGVSASANLLGGVERLLASELRAQGRAAGLAVAGSDGPRVAQATRFVVGLQIELLGSIEAGSEGVAAWKEAYRSGVVAFVREGVVRGLLLVNAPDRVPGGRELIASRRVVSAAELSSWLGGRSR